MGETTITENELLEELAAIYADQEISEDEVTAQMLADKAGITYKRAMYKLDTGVQNGKLKKRKVMLDGHLVNAYSKAE